MRLEAVILCATTRIYISLDQNQKVCLKRVEGKSPMTSSKMARFKVAISRAVLVAVLMSVGTITAYAGVLYSTGFENPPFTIGPLAGQDGWQVFGNTSVDVQSTVVYAGSQAVWVDGTNGQSGPYHSDFSTGPLVALSAYLYLGSSSTQSSWQFAGLGSGLFPFIGGIDTNSSTNDIALITAGFPVVGTFTRDTWHNVYFVFDFTTQKYNFWLDGTQLGTNVPFCGDNGPCLGETVSSYGTGLFDTFGGGNDSGYMDNYSVSTVPEPSSIALLGSGILSLAGMLWRRTIR
jgi:PEP-CTERM motif